MNGVNKVAVVLGGGASDHASGESSAFEDAAEDYAKATGTTIKNKGLFLSSLRLLLLEAQRSEE
jgi:hypothetical protein